MNTLHDEIVEGLSKGCAENELIEIVRHHKNRGMTQREANEILEGVWLELGCQQMAENPDSLQCDVLGGLMDRVWGYCSSQKSIWQTSLSGEYPIKEST